MRERFEEDNMPKVSPLVVAVVAALAILVPAQAGASQCVIITAADGTGSMVTPELSGLDLFALVRDGLAAALESRDLMQVNERSRLAGCPNVYETLVFGSTAQAEVCQEGITARSPEAARRIASGVRSCTPYSGETSLASAMGHLVGRVATWQGEGVRSHNIVINVITNGSDENLASVRNELAQLPPDVTVNCIAVERPPNLREQARAACEAIKSRWGWVWHLTLHDADLVRVMQAKFRQDVASLGAP